MFENESKVWEHYQKLQVSLSELISPEFKGANRSITLITLNQTYTYAERLFEMVEATTEISKNRQSLLAKLAHHIEDTKEKGVTPEFRRFIQSDLSFVLTVIREQFQKNFELAS